MTILRIVDNDGAVWPITGHRCLACRMPRDPAAGGRTHAGCDPGPPVSSADEARVIAALARRLGAAEIKSATTKEICMTDPRSANREDTLR